jgi:predicted metalloprotease with PDZ domain
MNGAARSTSQKCTSIAYIGFLASSLVSKLSDLCPVRILGPHMDPNNPPCDLNPGALVFAATLPLFAAATFGKFLINTIRTISACSFVALACSASMPFSSAYAADSKTIEIHVDATDVDHRILRVVETIPVVPGSLTLNYPEWIPGTHSPAFASAKRLAGLTLTADGKPVTWVRDTASMSEFHVEIPRGASLLTAEFQYLTPNTTTGDNSRISMSQDIVAVEWHSVFLYPAGKPASQIPITASLKLPEGFNFGTALEIDSTSGSNTRFKTTDLGTLVDSPVIAGRYFRKIDLAPGALVHVTLDLAADRPEDLVTTDDQIAAYRALVTQAKKLYASQHYDHYDFLLTLSDTIGEIGLEHHQSSEDGVRQDLFTDWNNTWSDRDLLPHEYTHSWNGKFRRPADLTTPDFNMPMRDTLLWMYEGQTQFWGKVLTARSGLVTMDQAREEIARNAAEYQLQPGRAWRDLQDTTNEEILSGHGHSEWHTWQRGADYYNEMVLVWLDVDTKIRELTGDRKSLDTFAATFFGVDDGSHVVKTYTFEDIVKTLNQVAPMDWRSFLRARLDQHDSAPLDGLARSGWKLIFNDTPNLVTAADEKRECSGSTCDADFSFSIGLNLEKDGKVSDVRWNGPAFVAGVAPANSVVAVNSRAYSKDVLSDAIVAAEHEGNQITLLVRDGDLYRSVRVDWHRGLSYPHLERIASMPDRLTTLLSPR